MKVRHSMKISIRDLFLVTMIVALVVGWFVEHRAASRLVGENVRLEQEAKQLRDQSGLLTVSDVTKLHAIAIASDLSHAENRWRWRLHFPSDRPFRICCQFADLPESGTPGGDQVLYDTKGDFLMNASVVKDKKGIWKLILDCDNGPNITMPIPNPQWLENDTPMVGGSQAGNRSTVSVNPGSPLILLKIRRAKPVIQNGKEIGSTVEMNPTEGIMVWVEEMSPSAPTPKSAKP